MTAGVLLAGGLSRRMGGGDKCLVELNGRPLLCHVIDRVQPQVGALVVNVNGDGTRFADFGLPVVADGIEGFAGPLAGVLAGMDWLREHSPEEPWLVSIPADTPFLPDDLVGRLLDAATAEAADLAVASSADRAHHAVALWATRLRPEIRHALTVEGLRKVKAFALRYRVATVDFKFTRIDPFFNVNAPDDLDYARQISV